MVVTIVTREITGVTHMNPSDDVFFGLSESEDPSLGRSHQVEPRSYGTLINLDREFLLLIMLITLKNNLLPLNSGM